MHYLKHYNELMLSRQRLNRSKRKGDGLERHHIVPKSIGGSNEPTNLVYLTYKEHFIAHLLLTKMFDGKNRAKMIYAFAKMCLCSPNQLRDRKVSSRYFEKVKLLQSQYCRGANHSSTGRKVHTEETKQKLKIRMTGPGNPSFGKPAWNKGLSPTRGDYKRTYTEKHRQSQRERMTGRLVSTATRQKVSAAQKGIPKSDEHKRKISESMTGRSLGTYAYESVLSRADKLRGTKQEIVTCPHCEIKGGKTAMYRWHMNNCKLNQIS